MKKIVIILSVLLLVGCGNKVSDKMPSDAFIDMKLEDIEVFQEMYVTDLVRDTNVKIEDYKLDTDTIGEKDIEFYYTYKGKKYFYETTIQVVDTVDPRIFGSSSKTVKVGYEGNLCNTVTYGDNYDGQVECHVEGDYDFNKVGKYNIEIVVTDVSGNSTNYKVTLKS